MADEIKYRLTAKGHLVMALTDTLGMRYEDASALAGMLADVIDTAIHNAIGPQAPPNPDGIVCSNCWLDPAVSPAHDDEGVCHADIYYAGIAAAYAVVLGEAMALEGEGEDRNASLMLATAADIRRLMAPWEAAER